MGLAECIGRSAPPTGLLILPGSDLRNDSPGHVGGRQEGQVTAGMNPAYTPRIRAFFGLPVPVEQREELASYLADCAPSAPEFRWTTAANLHLTVRFIGGIELSAAEAIADQLADRHLAGFELRVGAVRAFNHGPLVRVLSLPVDAH